MKKLAALLLAALMLLSLGTALAGENETARAKYVFFFIGDGMGAPQTTATRYYLGTRDNPDSAYPVPGKLSFDKFEAMLPSEQRIIGAEEDFLYGGYDPFTMAITHCLNNKAGLAYTSYAHTGMMLPVYANGAGAKNFVGSYDNTDIFHGFMQAMGLKIDTEIPALAAAK